MGDTEPVYGIPTPLGPGRRCSNVTHAHLAEGRYLEPDEVSRLFEWAREYHLDPVPEIQGLAHVFHLAGAYPDIAELPEAAFPDAYCPSNPKSYEVLFDVMEEYLELTKCTSVHIGHDEWRAGGLCPKCRERDTGELFAEDILKMTGWLAERGTGRRGCGAIICCPSTTRGDRTSTTARCGTTTCRRGRPGKILKQAGPNLTVLNWSWGFGKAETDDVIAELGLQADLRELLPGAFKDWAGRSADPDVLGGEVSSWCAWEDHALGCCTTRPPCRRRI